MLPSVGGVVDRYRLERLLGSGGLGDVWEVEHRVLGTRRALKVLRDGRGDLLSEGRVQARMDHPNVLPVLDAFGDDRGVALVLPLVRGPTLAGLLRQTALEVDEARAIALGVCAGLRFAHGRGVVHRDLKPANILLDPSGSSVVPRIADFGLAGALGDRAGRGAGTPGYAAPEQLKGDPVGEAADWWAFGIVVYEMLVGHRPFDVVLPRPGQRWEVEPPEAWTGLLRGLLLVDPDERSADGQAIEAAIRALPRVRRVAPLSSDGRLAGQVHRAAAKPGGAQSDPGSQATVATSATFRTEVDAEPEPEAPSFATEPADHHNLPSERDTLVGRQAELRRLRARLLEDGVRVLTIAGPGGVGKSRVAQALGRSVVVDHPGGVWAVDLSGADDADEVRVRLGAALSLPLPDRAQERLFDALRARGDTLLLLEQAESALEALREVVDPLLDDLPGLRVLTTSREPVRFVGESVYSLDVLELPSTSEEQPALARAQASPAVELFVQRARAARSDFVLDASNAEDVVALVRVLDGLPLALELAAARVRVLAPSKLLQRMSRRFDLLVRKRGGDGPARQRTLRGALLASWDTLNADERSALAQLGIFEGSPTLDDIEAVIALPDPHEFVEDVLSNLVDKSLVRVRHGEEVHFELLRSVQDLAREKLAGVTDEQALVRRHAERFARWGTGRLRDVLGGHGGVTKRRRLAADREDLLRALRTGLRQQEPALATPCAIAAWTLLEITGPLAMAAELIEQAARLDPGHAELQRCLATARLRTARHEEAAEAFAVALATFRTSGDPVGGAEVQNGIGLLHLAKSEVDEAETAFLAALELGRAAGNDRIRGVIEANRVLIAWRRRDLPEALDRARAALPLHEAAGDRRSAGRTQGNLGVVLHELGHLEEAREVYSRALVALREVGDTRDEGLFLGQLGLLRTEFGDLEGAERALQRSLRLSRRVGARAFEAAALGNLGIVYGLREDWEGASTHHLRARALHRELGDARSAMIDTANMGVVALERGDRLSAGSLLDEAIAGAREAGDRRAQGAFLADRARVYLARGERPDATAVLDEAQELLLSHGGIIEQLKARCVRVEWLRATGDIEGSSALLDAIRSEAERAGVRPTSALGRAIERVSQAPL